MKTRRWIIELIFIPLLILIGCKEKEKVDRGRVIAFDRIKGKITLIRDKKFDLQSPDYSQLPPVTYVLFNDLPRIDLNLTVGLRMKLNAETNQIIIYDPTEQKFKTINYTLLTKKEGIAIENPLVFDTDKRRPKTFPIIDREYKMITVYSRRQQILTTFTLPEKYFDLPEYTWNAGDEVRIYYKEEGKALRLINTTKLGFIED